jgi:hypothetical protein
MAFLVCHFRKIKTGTGLVNVSRHNARQEKLDAQEPEKKEWLVHPEFAIYNHPHGFSNERGIMRVWIDVVNDYMKSGMRKPQKNAAHGIETIYSASPEFWDALRKECKNENDFFDKADGFFHELLKVHQAHFGNHTLQYSIHYDEKEPHMHVIDQPIMEIEKDGKTVWRYSSGHYLGGRTGMANYHTELFKKVGEKWGLERGLEGSKARHTDQAQWMAEREAAVLVKTKELDEREAAVQDREAVVEVRETKAKDRETAVQLRETDVKVLEKRIKAQGEDQFIKNGKLLIKEAAILDKEKDVKEREIVVTEKEVRVQAVIKSGPPGIAKLMGDPDKLIEFANSRKTDQETLRQQQGNKTGRGR